MESKLIVGLEIHVQLATRTKLFCSCRLAFADPPNSNVCPVCLGLPGSLPVMNKTAYEYAVRTAIALNCRISPFTKWDRKGYYYPDLPKNYQISQYDLPTSQDGHIDISLESGETKTVRILRAHLEEDAGKNLHEGLPHSQVDLNRTGTPLLEIVTQPDMNSPEECRTLAIELQKLVQFLGVSEANMQKGHMRFEPNINLEITDDNGQRYRTPICEIKNLNSFRSLERAVAYEQWRHLEQFKQDKSWTIETHGKQNRGWDDNRNQTVYQREKEASDDYRYFPEPDLVPVEMDEIWLSQINSTVCELPSAMKSRFIEQYLLNEYDAGVLTADRSTAEYFDAAVKAQGPEGASVKRLANIITQTGAKIANERNCTIDRLGIEPRQLAKLAEMVETGMVSATAANTVFEKMVESGGDPEQLAERFNLLQTSDASELEAIVDEIIASNGKAAEDVRISGKKSVKARGFLLGQIMQKTKGGANPKIAGELLDKKLGSNG